MISAMSALQDALIAVAEHRRTTIRDDRLRLLRPTLAPPGSETGRVRRRDDVADGRLIADGPAIAMLDEIDVKSAESATADAHFFHRFPVKIAE